MKTLKLIFLMIIGLFLFLCDEQTKPIVTENDLEITDIVGMTASFDAVAPFIKIRYYDSRNTGLKLTATFNPDGYTLNKYRLTKDGMVENDLKEYSVAQGIIIPHYDPAPRYISVKDTIIQPDGTWIFGNVLVENPNYDPDALSKFVQARNELFVWLEANLQIQEWHWYKSLPHGDYIIWELVHPELPYQQRYEQIPVDPNLYTGPKWILSNISIYDRFSYWACQT